MSEQLHQRLPLDFVMAVVAAFNDHRLSEARAGELLGLKRVRLYRVRARWLRSQRSTLRLVKKDGTISFLSRLWKVGQLPGQKVTVCYRPGSKLIVVKEGQRLWEYHL